MTDATSKISHYIISNLPWKHFDELIRQIAHGELSKITDYDTEKSETKFLKVLDFVSTEEKEFVIPDTGFGFDFTNFDIKPTKFEKKIKEIIISLTPRGKEYYIQKFVKNNETEAKRILEEALKLHPSVILISQILSGSKNIKRINIYNLLKHHNFDLNFQKEVDLNNFLEILKLGGIVSYNKNTRDVKVLWQQDTEILSFHQFISPETPYSNIKRLKDIIKSLKGTVYWIDKHFDKKAFDILLDSLDATKIIHFIIISGDANKTQSAVSDFVRFKNELHSRYPLAYASGTYLRSIYHIEGCMPSNSL